MTRVRTGSRLHFGLMHLPPAEPWPEFLPGTNVLARYFGGVGMMVEEPAVEVTAQVSEDWRFDGKCCDRAKIIASSLNTPPQHVTVRHCPLEHTGLGVGTQLSLAVATALTHGANSPQNLARSLDRGKRSAIGVNGFALGGFLIDAGKTRTDELSTIVVHEQVPQSWLVLLLTPKVESTWSGERERMAFAELRGDQRWDEIMDHLITTAILPACRSADVAKFGAAITEFNIRAGEMFRRVQRGRYAHPAVETLVTELLQHGFAGAGQSSWGPTVFAFSDDPDRIDFFNRRLVTPTSCSMVVTRGRNQGAELASGAA